MNIFAVYFVTNSWHILRNQKRKKNASIASEASIFFLIRFIFQLTKRELTCALDIHRVLLEIVYTTNICAGTYLRGSFSIVCIYTSLSAAICSLLIVIYNHTSRQFSSRSHWLIAEKCIIPPAVATNQMSNARF